MKTLSRHAPLTVHRDVDLGLSTAVKSMDVNSEPWSVWKISGLP